MNLSAGSLATNQLWENVSHQLDHDEVLAIVRLLEGRSLELLERVLILEAEVAVLVLERSAMAVQ